MIFDMGRRLKHATEAGSGTDLSPAIEKVSREDDGRIVIDPASTPSYNLDALVAGMTPETFPEEVDFGQPMGKEICGF